MNTKEDTFEKHDKEYQGEVKEKLLNTISRITNIFNFRQKQSLRESLEEILDENQHTEEDIPDGQKAIIRNILEFNELYVEDIMIPRSDIFSIPSDIDFENLQEKLLGKTYTRIPVYKGDLDEVLGFIHIKDVARSFFNKTKLKIADIIRKCLFVPASMKIGNLLIRMQQSHVHIAIVVDEYGGTEGIVTLEDIIEEIVGNIEDEHVREDTNLIFNKLNDNEYEVSSRMYIEDIIKKTELDIKLAENNEYDTIGGLIFNLTSRIPVKGEIIKMNDEIEFEILEADPRRLKRLMIRKLTKKE
ncbi:MAG TPA: HlyC/CorC family transporter [Alphaproteobacteria bacterium]|nr:HlyC/CorC family transporter [Alphaproteobacteria bacterium]